MRDAAVGLLLGCVLARGLLWPLEMHLMRRRLRRLDQQAEQLHKELHSLT